jgi:chromosome segregation ATPase
MYRDNNTVAKIMSEPIDEMQKHLAEAEAEIARLKGEITELTKHVQLGAEHKKDPIWAMIKAEMANQGYRKGYDQAMEKSHQLEDQLAKAQRRTRAAFGRVYPTPIYRRSSRVTFLADSR